MTRISLGIIFLVFTVVIFTSCNKIYYNIAYVFDDQKILDTGFNKLNIRIINEGKVGLSSLMLVTDSGKIILKGARPGETTRYYAIPPIYSRPNYETQIVRYSIFGKSNVEANMCCIYQNRDSTKLAPGYYSIYIQLPKKNDKFRMRRFHIARDK